MSILIGKFLGVEYSCDMDYDKYRDERGRYAPCRVNPPPCELPKYVAYVDNEFRIYVDEAFRDALSPEDVLRILLVNALRCAKW